MTLPSRVGRTPLGAAQRSPLGVLGRGGGAAFAIVGDVLITLEADSVTLRLRHQTFDTIFSEIPVTIGNVVVFDEGVRRAIDAGFISGASDSYIAAVRPLPIDVLGPVAFSKTDFIDTGLPLIVPPITYPPTLPTWEEVNYPPQVRASTGALVGDTFTISFDTPATAWRTKLLTPPVETGGVLLRFAQGPTPMFAGVSFSTFINPAPVSFTLYYVELQGRIRVTRLP